MSKGQWALRPAALKRVIKAAQDAGLTVSGFRINPQGEIHVETVAPQAQEERRSLSPVTTRRQLKKQRLLRATCFRFFKAIKQAVTSVSSRNAPATTTLA
jgi:hypothetical protein